MINLAGLYRNHGMRNNGDHDSNKTMMMMIGDHYRPNPTVHIPPWDNHLEDPTAHIHSQYDVVEAADCDIPVDAYSCDDFRMFEFKVTRCARARSHDWTECPYAHPGEKARRRDPRRFHYSGGACPDFRRGACKRGDSCEYAHGVFECWLHPARYRTQLCKDGTHCRRRVCFFAHTAEQLRVPPVTGGSSDDSPPLSSPTTASPPVSPAGSARVNQLTESMRVMGLSGSPPSWRVGFGSKIRPGFSSLPTTPVRAVTRSGLSTFDLWETSHEEEEPVMERVESGRALRERIYANLVKENSLERTGPVASVSPVQDFEWVSELVS